MADDRADIAPGDRVVLIMVGEVPLASLLLDRVRANGMKGIVALRGDTGLALARERGPQSIVLDLLLPILDGWTILDRLKHDPVTRHIPVQVISAAEGERRRALRLGAFAFLCKPVSTDALDRALERVGDFLGRGVRRLLLVAAESQEREQLLALVASDDLECTTTESAARAVEQLAAQPYDCVLVGLAIPDVPDFIARITDDPRFEHLPVVVHTGRPLNSGDEASLNDCSERGVVKIARSPEHVLDETTLFLHRDEAVFPEDKRRMMQQIRDSDPVFVGKRVLVVDDDVRNIFAVTAVLERHGMEVAYAEDGRRALEVLRANPDVDLVLMDVMMPEMDGYETTAEIRRNPEFATLPIIALTAKAMKGDREKCMAAGASDYVTKPVETEQLLSVLRIWLC